MNDSLRLWADPQLVYPIAVAAVVLLVITIGLFRRRKRSGRPAAMICLFLSLVLHGLLIFLVPLIPAPPGGSGTVQPEPKETGATTIDLSVFLPDESAEMASGEQSDASVTPLPVSPLEDLISAATIENPPPQPESSAESTTEAPDDSAEVPELLSQSEMPEADWLAETLDQSVDQMLDELQSVDPPATSQLAQDSDATDAVAATDSDPSLQQASQQRPVSQGRSPMVPQSAATAPATAAHVVGAQTAEFAARQGAAKQLALATTGGDLDTEAAVKKALRYLANAQRSDGAWDPRLSGAGVERSPLGESRPQAGTRCESAITGLSILALLGSGNTHRDGEYQTNVYRGLSYLIGIQRRDGCLAGDATIYASTYSHGMAALAMAETAAMTNDASAIEATRGAVNYSRSLQHPTTGGFRYTRGSTGDLSQLGWQAMVIDAADRADVAVNPAMIAGVRRFLRSVRVGSQGGLASYRPGEKTSRTMTAEALATRLLLGETVPTAEIDEAERFMLSRPPGVGQDNYYYWYYATMALHQLQDDAWQQWNTALKDRLLQTQRSDGSWPASSVWGGYGGTVYTTAMATLCLETYYRHTLRPTSRVARQPSR